MLFEPLASKDRLKYSSFSFLRLPFPATQGSVGRVSQNSRILIVLLK